MGHTTGTTEPLMSMTPYLHIDEADLRYKFRTPQVMSKVHQKVLAIRRPIRTGDCSGKVDCPEDSWFGTLKRCGTRMTMLDVCMCKRKNHLLLYRAHAASSVQIQLSAIAQ